MRIKIEAKILSKASDLMSYNHEMYSMIVENLSKDIAEKNHAKEKFLRTFTFSGPFLDNKKVHFYMSGEDSIIRNFLSNIINKESFRIGNIDCKLLSILYLDAVNFNEKLKFKGRIIVNEIKDGEVTLSTDMNFIAKRIPQIIRDKFRQIHGFYPEDTFNVDIISLNKKFCRYKDQYLYSYNMIFTARGSSELIKLMYQLGAGENTASGHGFLWQI